MHAQNLFVTFQQSGKILPVVAERFWDLALQDTADGVVVSLSDGLCQRSSSRLVRSLSSWLGGRPRSRVTVIGVDKGNKADSNLGIGDCVLMSKGAQLDHVAVVGDNAMPLKQVVSHAAAISASPCTLAHLVIMQRGLCLCEGLDSPLCGGIWVEELAFFLRRVADLLAPGGVALLYSRLAPQDPLIGSDSLCRMTELIAFQHAVVHFHDVRGYEQFQTAWYAPTLGRSPGILMTRTCECTEDGDTSSTVGGDTIACLQRVFANLAHDESASTVYQEVVCQYRCENDTGQPELDLTDLDVVLPCGAIVFYSTDDPLDDLDAKHEYGKRLEGIGKMELLDAVKAHIADQCCCGTDIIHYVWECDQRPRHIYLDTPAISVRLHARWDLEVAASALRALKTLACGELGRLGALLGSTTKTQHKTPAQQLSHAFSTIDDLALGTLPSCLELLRTCISRLWSEDLLGPCSREVRRIEVLCGRVPRLMEQRLFCKVFSDRAHTACDPANTMLPLLASLAAEMAQPIVGHVQELFMAIAALWPTSVKTFWTASRLLSQRKPSSDRCRRPRSAPCAPPSSAATAAPSRAPWRRCAPPYKRRRRQASWRGRPPNGLQAWRCALLVTLRWRWEHISAA